LPDGLRSANGYTNFFFLNDIPLVAGQTYYFQPVAEAGSDSFAAIADINYNYAGGTMYVHGVPPTFGNFDLWFREGVYVVPEPASLSLLIIGTGVFVLRRRRK
jgi:hypothetical protein